MTEEPSPGAVRRAIEILELIAERETFRSLRAIAAATGLPKSSVARIMNTLEETEMVANERGLYVVGPRFRRLGIRALDGLDVRVLARSTMAELARATGETVSLNVRFGDIRMYVEQVESQNMLLAKGEIGRPYPLLVGAPGRALIYPLDDASVNDLLKHSKLEKYTINTPITAETVWAAIRQARELGAAIARDEVIPGLATVAVPVMDDRGSVVAALGVTGPSSRISDEALLDLRGLVSNFADGLSRACGSQIAQLRPSTNTSFREREKSEF